MAGGIKIIRAGKTKSQSIRYNYSGEPRSLLLSQKDNEDIYRVSYILLNSISIEKIDTIPKETIV